MMTAAVLNQYLILENNSALFLLFNSNAQVRLTKGVLSEYFICFLKGSWYFLKYFFFASAARIIWPNNLITIRRYTFRSHTSRCTTKLNDHDEPETN